MIGDHKIGAFTFSVRTPPFWDRKEEGPFEVLVRENKGLHSAYVNLVEDPRFAMLGQSPLDTVPPGLEYEHGFWVQRRGAWDKKEKDWKITQPVWRLSRPSLLRMMTAASPARTVYVVLLEAGGRTDLPVETGPGMPDGDRVSLAIKTASRSRPNARILGSY